MCVNFGVELMSTSAQKETNAWIKITKMLVTITFSVLIIYTIVIALIDEVISRYGAIGFGLAIVLLSNPLAHSLPVGDRLTHEMLY